MYYVRLSLLFEKTNALLYANITSLSISRPAGVFFFCKNGKNVCRAGWLDVKT